MPEASRISRVRGKFDGMMQLSGDGKHVGGIWFWRRR